MLLNASGSISSGVTCHYFCLLQRTSIYYQEPKNYNKNKVYDDFARLTIGGALSPTVVKLREVAVAQTLPKKLAGWLLVCLTLSIP